MDVWSVPPMDTQRWVDATRQLSGRAVRDLLVFSTGQLHAWRRAVAGQPAARVVFTADAAWRSFTGARLPSDGVLCAGPKNLTEPVFTIRGIIA